MITQETLTLAELLKAALDSRAEIARLERLLADARQRDRRLGKELADHPEVEEDRAYYRGHCFEWRASEPVQIWPCRYFPSLADGAKPTPDFA